MQDLRVTLVQANQIWENKAANFENYHRLLQGVSTDLILLPEMFSTGFTMNALEMAEDFNQSESLEWLRTLAKEKNAAVYTSLIMTENSLFFNRGVFVMPDNQYFVYDKRKAFSLAGENEIYQSGTNETIVAYWGWNIQLQICYDLRFPEIVRNRITSNQNPLYDVILYVANWPEKRNSHWKCLLRARAIENQSYVLGVNRVGTDDSGLSYTGDSVVVNPLGETCELETQKEMVKTFVIKKSELNAIREKLPFLKDQ